MIDEDETPENRVRFRSPLVSAKASSFGRIQTLIVAVVLRTTTLWIARRPLLLPKNFLLRVDFLMLKNQLELRGVIPLRKYLTLQWMNWSPPEWHPEYTQCASVRYGSTCYYVSQAET